MSKETTTELFRKQLASRKKTSVGPNWFHYSNAEPLDVPVGKGNLKVWLGDPCYVLHDEIYENVFGARNYHDGLYVYDNGKDLYWFNVESTGGDGTFTIIGTQTTKKKNELGVDAGVLCVMSANLTAQTFEDEKIYNRKDGEKPSEDVREKDTEGGVFYTFRDDVEFVFNYEPFYIQAFSQRAYFRIWDGDRIFRGINDEEGIYPDEIQDEYGPTDAEYIKRIKKRGSKKPVIGKYD